MNAMSLFGQHTNGMPAYAIRRVQPAGQVVYGDPNSPSTYGGKTATPTGGISDATVNTLGSIANVTAATIQAALASGNAIEIARINAAAAQRIAELQVRAGQLQQANPAASLQAQQEADRIRQYQLALAQAQAQASAPRDNTMLYVVGGVAVLGIAAALLMAYGKKK